MLLFLGDSITESWCRDILYRDYSQYNPINLAKSVDTTKDLLNIIRSSVLDTLRPIVIVILIGTNNLTVFNDSPEIVASDIRLILDILLDKYPSSRIILKGLLPRGKYPDDTARVYTSAVNSLISKFANDTNITYLDNSKEFLYSDGSIMNNLMPDNCHLSREGYEVLSRCLTPLIVKHMEGTESYLNVHYSNLYYF
jgi:lysophospholipase L1-like esterase